VIGAAALRPKSKRSTRKTSQPTITKKLIHKKRRGQEFVNEFILRRGLV
jgi:hypothetical protein